VTGERGECRAHSIGTHGDTSVGRNKHDGRIFKASQGLRFRYEAWLDAERGALLTAAGERYGVDLFDRFYHFLTLHEDSAAQADAFVRVVEHGGGDMRGTLCGMVDVERGG